MSHHKAPEAIRAHMRRVGLSIPIEAAGDIVSEVYLRRPTASYLAEAERLDDDVAGPAEAKFLTVSLATGLTMSEVKGIDLEDFARVLDEIADFFDSAASQKTTPGDGGASSLTAPQS